MLTYEKEIRYNEKTGQEYEFLRPKRDVGQTINPAPFEQAMRQSQVGMAHDKQGDMT